MASAVVVRKLLTTWGFKVDKAKVQSFSSSIDRAKINVGKANKGVKTLGKNVAQLGKIALAAGAAITGGLALPALKLEDSLKDTMTLVGLTGDEFKRIESGMKDFGITLSNELNMTAVEINKGFYQVLSTGAEALSDDFVALSKTALKLGKTVGLTATDAVEKLADSVNAFNLPMTEAQDVADKFFKTSILAATSVPQLTMAMRDAGPTAAGLNVSLSETLAILGAFAQGGIKGAEAGTAFKMVLSRLAAPVGEAAAWMKKLKVETFDTEGTMRPLIDILGDYIAALGGLNDESKAAAVSAIAGKLAMSKFLGLMNKDINVLKRWNKELQNSEGALDRAFNIKMSSGIQQLGKLKQQIVNTAAVIGTDLIPKIKSMVEALSVGLKKNQKEIKAWGKDFISSVESAGKTLFKHRDMISKVATTMAALWATSKIGVWLTTSIGAITKLASFAAAHPFLIAAATLATGIAGKVKSEQQHKEFLSDLEEEKKRRKARLNEAEKAKQAMIIARSGGKLTGEQQRLSETFFPQLMAFEKAGKKVPFHVFNRMLERGVGSLVVTATKVGKTTGKALAAGIGEGTKSELQKELDKIFQTGFGADTKKAFQQFLLFRNQRSSDQQSVLGAWLGRKLPNELFGSNMVGRGGQGGSSQTTIHKTYHIRSTSPRGVMDEIERRDRDMASDFGTSPLTSVKIPFE